MLEEARLAAEAWTVADAAALLTVWAAVRAARAVLTGLPSWNNGTALAQQIMIHELSACR